MAELPRYRPLGASIPSIPTVDFTATGRAQAGVFESVSRGLDVMSRYVASQAEARTKVEAAQWAYDRDLTAEQLTAALESGQSVDQILGDPTTVFGSVSIATTADKLSADLTADARMRLADLSARIDGGADLDINSEMADINSLSAGYADLLSTLDPKVASSFSASVATLSAPVYQKGLERQIKLATSVKMASAEATMAALPGILEDYFETDKGSVVIGSDMLVSEGQAATAIEAVSKELLRTNDAAFFTEQTGKFPEMIATAKINVLSNYAVELPAAKRMSALRTGDFGDKTALFNTLTDEQKITLRKQVRDEIAARQAADDQTRKDNVLVAKQDAVDHVINYLGNGEQDDIDALAEIARVYPEVIDGQGIASLVKNRIEISQPGYYEAENPAGVFSLRAKIISGQITDYATLEAEGEALGVGPKQILSLAPTLDAANKSEISKVDAEARRHTGLVTGMINVSEKKAKAVNSFIANVDERFNSALENWEDGGRTGDRPVRSVIAREYRLELAGSSYQKNIDRLLGNLKEKFPALDDIDEYTSIEEIIDNQGALGLGDDDIEFIRKRLSRIEDNQILRDELM